MISQACDLEQFIEAISDRDYLEVIYLADKEATEAERIKYRSKVPPSTPPREGCPHYADVLKGFIYFMRYGVKNPLISDRHVELFRPIREKILQASERDNMEGEVSPA